VFMVNVLSMSVLYLFESASPRTTSSAINVSRGYLLWSSERPFVGISPSSPFNFSAPRGQSASHEWRRPETSRLKAANMAAVDSPNSNRPLMASSGPSSRQRSDRTMSP